MCRSSLPNQISRHKAGVSLAAMLSEDVRFLAIDLSDPATLRAAVARLAAELRPGVGAVNSGLTPRWYRDRVAILDALRVHLAAAEDAAEVRP
jgi:hypothetical protein